MTIKLPATVLNFDSGQNKFYENFADYWNHFRTMNSKNGKKYPYKECDENGKEISFAQKEEALGKLLLKEVAAKSGVEIGSMSPEQMATHPLVSWAVGNIASQMIDAVLPQTIIDSTSVFCETKVVGWGETGIFDVRFRDLFPVTRVGKLGMRHSEMHKGFDNQRTINPVNHAVTVGVSLFRVLSGQENLSTFTVRALQSIETEMSKDIYTAFAGAFTGLSTDATTGLQVTGFTSEDLILLGQKVESFSGGARATVVGTKAALSQVLPDDANYRYDLSSEYVKLGYVRTLAGFDTLELPQVADWTNPFATVINNSSLWIIAPGTDKIVKNVIGGSTISFVNPEKDSAMLLANATFQKMWTAGVCSSSIGGLITLS
jgi:hypothetical protein